jgi:hypothetical protein
VSELRDPLDDLLAEIPAHVVPDARAAWAAGARRRVRRRLGAVAAVLVLVALAGALVAGLPRAVHVTPADGDDGGVDGYPARIEKPWFVRDLPDRPGPLAAVFESDADWYAVSARGTVWRVPQGGAVDSFPPALSADGRMIGYLTGSTTFVLRDLVTGEETSFPQVTDNAETRADEGDYWVASQAPAHWSPDGTRLLVRGGAWADGSTISQYVLGVDGSVTEVASTRGQPAGWLDDDRLAWIGTRAGRLELTTTDAQGAVESRTPVDVRARRVSQWAGALSPDRSRLAVVVPNSTGSLVTVSTGDGAVVRRDHVGASDRCSPAWAGDEPAFVQADGATNLDTTYGLALMTIDPAFDATCLLVATDALAGARHQGLPERLLGDGWASWHWRGLVAGTVAAALAVAAGAVLLVRRRRLSGGRAPGSA